MSKCKKLTGGNSSFKQRQLAWSAQRAGEGNQSFDAVGIGTHASGAVSGVQRRVATALPCFAAMDPA